jgi:hypothetical protein
VNARAGRIDAYLDALDVALADVGHAPSGSLHIADVAPYFLDVEAVDIVERLRRLDADAASDAAVGALFPCANSIKTLLMDLVCGLKVAGIDREQRVAVTERMFDAMAARETGDIFCRDGCGCPKVDAQALSWGFGDSAELA